MSRVSSQTSRHSHSGQCSYARQSVEALLSYPPLRLLLLEKLQQIGHLRNADFLLNPNGHQ